MCDTTFDIAVHTNDDFQCCELEGQFCEDREVEIKDITCRRLQSLTARKLSHHFLKERWLCSVVVVGLVFQQQENVKI